MVALRMGTRRTLLPLDWGAAVSKHPWGAVKTALLETSKDDLVEMVLDLRAEHIATRAIAGEMAGVLRRVREGDLFTFREIDALLKRWEALKP